MVTRLTPINAISDLITRDDTMSIFKRTPQKPVTPLLAIGIRFNLSRLDSWMEEFGVIEAEYRWSSEDKQVRYEISMLLFDHFLYHHHTPNRYSRSVAGHSTLDTKSSVTVNWDIIEDVFVVWVEVENQSKPITIFEAPIEKKVWELIIDGKLAGDNIRKDASGYILTVGNRGPCCALWYSGSMDCFSFRNELARVSFTLPRLSDQMSYER